MDEDDVVRPFPRRRPERPRAGSGGLWRTLRTRVFWIVVPLILLVGSVLRFWVDLLWFKEVGQRDVLVTRLQWGLAMGIGFGLLTFAMLYLNFRVARKVAREDLYVPFLAVGADPEAPEQPVIPHFVLRPILLGVAALGGVIAGLTMSSRWEVVLRFLGRTDFGVKDPHFGKDASFYVFTMPLLELVARSLQVLIVVTAIAVVLAYVATGVIRYTPMPRVARTAIVHLSWLVAAFLLVSAFQYRLSIWSMATSTRGYVAGAGWTDTHARIPGYWLMILASIVLAVLVVMYARKEKWRVVGGAVVGWFAASIVVTGLLPTVVQQVLVEPNQLERETKLIEGNIANTRAGFNLDEIETTSFVDKQQLTETQLTSDNRGTTDNLRLWSPFVLNDVINQDQVIKRYYAFHDPDVDRYTIGGDYRQVMVAVRELDPGANDLAPGWTNERLAYTHGYGAVATLPNEVTREGKPEYLLRNLSLQTTDEADAFKLTRPEVYFGEAGSDFVIVGTKQREVSGSSGEDGAEGDEPRSTKGYEGDGGIPVKGFMRRVAFASTFRDPRILFSGQFTNSSKVMLRRRITERVRELAPFLELDRDPYAVIDEGRIKWIIDAYTTSDRFPYSEAIELGGVETAAGPGARRSINYVRNSVKVVVDAYDGDVTLYATDGEDPILQAWTDIFPDLFEPLEKMPKALRAHVRYPEDLFAMQTERWKRYHMADVNDFYAREDEWDVPSIDNQPMQAYYVLAKLPGAKEEELLLIRPMTPRDRKNMVSYMVARSDGERYGEVQTLRLSTQEATQGPSQIQARIKQDSDVARQVREWTTGNNTVVFGDLLVLPVEDSLLYAQPVYLVNDEAKIPEFRRIVLALGQTIAWGDDFPQAAERLLAEQAADVQDAGSDSGESTDSDASDGAEGGDAPATDNEGDTPDVPAPAPGDFKGMSQAELATLLGKVSAAYDRAEACQVKGDTVCYAEQLEQVEQLLAEARPAADS
ncbi:MAG: hypothetical protein JWL76_344 [Thermoleophilia bacterium]|nr:hypothetical protein [Thermoleophilia bacterium]